MPVPPDDKLRDDEVKMIGLCKKLNIIQGS